MKWEVDPLITDDLVSQYVKGFLSDQEFNGLLTRDCMNFIENRLTNVPVEIKRKLVREYISRYHKSKHSNPLRTANIYLRKATQYINATLEQLPLEWAVLSNKHKLKKQAEACAIDCYDLVTQHQDKGAFGVYLVLAKFADNWNIRPQYSELAFDELKDIGFDKVTSVIARLCAEKWWRKKLDRLHVTTLEYIHIAIGDVGKTGSAYVSEAGLNAFIQRQKAEVNFLENMEIVNEQGECLPLSKVYQASVANPEVRRVELLVRVRGIAEWAEENDYQAIFITQTAPSQYHRNSKEWNGSSPKQTQAYFTELFKLIRAEYGDLGIKPHYLRVVEPHKDGTPHWHCLFFVKKHECQALIDVYKRYAIKQDAHELKSKHGIKPRFDVEFLDGSRGAVAYISKYLAKNVSAKGITDFVDDESGLALDDAVISVTAWARIHGLRQFQFSSGAPVSIWRECRRLKDVEIDDPIIADAVEASCNSRFKDFINSLGGLNADSAISTVYESHENEYGEITKKIVGIEAIKQFITHSEKWEIRKKKPKPKQPPKRCDSNATRTLAERRNNCNSNINDSLKSVTDKSINQIEFEIDIASTGLDTAVKNLLYSCSNFLTQ
ncbi:replication endonuclease [Catenovulum sp. SM1970]|uniref:replication endonuclease n=1 Tax=Marinifaba aquimaris TaxID=2741323 RepID=UPI0015716155|nr:replication endonuclease [Marinifaba aquimaris]NTS77333.1 replication endonuclease [Marinifaba aquimaris]